MIIGRLLWSPVVSVGNTSQLTADAGVSDACQLKAHVHECVIETAVAESPFANVMLFGEMIIYSLVVGGSIEQAERTRASAAREIRTVMLWLYLA